MDFLEIWQVIEENLVTIFGVYRHDFGNLLKTTKKRRAHRSERKKAERKALGEAETKTKCPYSKSKGQCRRARETGKGDCKKCLKYVGKRPH